MTRITRVSSVPREHALVRGASDRLWITVDPVDPILHNCGGYGRSGDMLPLRYRFLEPGAHESLVLLEQDFPGCVYYTDVFRNATGSKRRREKNRRKRIEKGQSAIYTGLLPGSSGHGFGLCTDHFVSDNIRRLRRHLDDPEFDKEDYDLLLRNYGWYCHRDGPHGDHKRGSEWWHFNYFGDDPDRWLSHSHRRTKGGLDAKIDAMYGPFTLDAAGIEETLLRLGYLIDDSHPVADAVRAFQETWTLSVDGIAGPVTQRVLLYVGAGFRDSDGNDIDVPFP